MHIGLVSLNANPLERVGAQEGSGQNVLVDGLARAFGALGHTVSMYIRPEHRPPPARLSPAPNVEIVVLGPGLDKTSQPATPGSDVEELGARLRDAWATRRPDAIHAFGLTSGQATLRAACGEGLPFVQTLCHLPPRESSHNGPRGDIASLLRSAARTIATSSPQVFSLLGLGASPAAIRFVPCGVDLRAFAPMPAAERKRERLRIVTLGNIGLREGIGDVIEALALLEGVELVVGGGAYAQSGILADADAVRWQALAQRCGVADRVRFRGHVERDEVASLLRSADIVVCPPHDDSMGIVALEAMACGIPPIVSAVGGLVDVVADGMTGIHVPARAPRQLAYAIEALGSDRARRERFGRFGVERTAARYGWPRIAAQTLEIYGGVVASNSQLQQSRR